MKPHPSPSPLLPAPDPGKICTGASTAASAEPRRQPGRPIDWDKRQAIIEAGFRLFLDQGYERSSVDEIASRAQVSKQTIYRHFGGKEALFRAAIQQKGAEFAPQLTIANIAEHDPAEVLSRLGTGFTRLIASPEAIGLHRLLLAEAATTPQLARIFYEEGPQRMVEMLAEYLSAASAAGRLRVPDPSLAAEQFLGLLKGLDHLRELLCVGAATAPEIQARRVAASVEMFMARYGVPA